MTYAWLLKQNGLDVRRCRFIALLKDHSKSKAKTDATYPQSPVFVYEFEVTPEELTATGDRIKAKVQDIEEAEQTADDNIDPCTAEERWADGDKYAVMKNGRKTAVRVFDTQADADACAGKLGNSHYVEHRPANATIPLFFFRKLCYIISMTATKLSTAANILKNAGCTDIYLFGSQARGVANENSDIDLGVKGLPPSMFFRVHLQLENALDMKVDLVDFDYQKSFFNLLRDIGELKQIG